VTDGQISSEGLHETRRKDARKPWLDAGWQGTIREMDNGRKTPANRRI